MRLQVSKLRPSRCLSIHINNLCIILAMETDKKLHEAFWPDIPGKWVSFRHSEKPCFKNQEHNN